MPFDLHPRAAPEGVITPITTDQQFEASLRQPLQNPSGARSAMRRDIASAYLAAAARAGSWALVMALLFRRVGEADFAPFALVRGTIGLLNLASLGLAAAAIHLLAHPAAAGAANENQPPQRFIYTAAIRLATQGAIVGCLLLAAYATLFNQLHQIPLPLHLVMPAVALFMGFGTLLRNGADPASALLQVRGQITRDNMLAAATELVWLFGSFALVLALPAKGHAEAAAARSLLAVAVAFAFSGGFLYFARYFFAGKLLARDRDFQHPSTSPASFMPAIRRALLALGLPIVLTQLADYLYAPTDYILINHFLDPRWIADYQPAVLIDSGLLLLAVAVASVLLPKAALAHAGGQRQAVRRYWLFGTLATAGALTAAALIIWAIAPWLFRVWLGSDMPITRQILPLVLIHTVVGGSSAVSRAILLAIGKVNAFAVSVLIAGACNVIGSYVLAVPMHMGLTGIVLGTVIAVVGRCAIWMPWYVWRQIRVVQTQT